MKNTHNWLIVSIVIISIILLLGIWGGLPLWLDEINPLVTITSLVLLSIIVIILSSSILFYIFRRQVNLSENPETENQKKLKAELYKEKNLHCARIRQVSHYLMLTFKLITQKSFRVFRRLPFYLAINAKDAESEQFFEKNGLDYLSVPNLSSQNSLNNFYGSLYQWKISKQAVILNIQSKDRNNGLEKSEAQESFWGIQPASYQWLGILSFLKKFRKYRALNGLIVTLNFPKFVMQPESETAKQFKELSELIQILYSQFNDHIPVYFVFTQISAIAGFHEFFADLNAEQRGQPWGIAFPQTGLFTAQEWLNYIEKEFNNITNILNAHLFVRLETEKEMDNRCKISCFPQQIELCKPSLKKLVSQTSELFVRGIYFVGNAISGKVYDFAGATVAMRFGLPLREPRYINSKYDYFSKKIIPELILNDVNLTQNKSYFQKFKNVNDQFRSIIAIGILSISSIGFLASYSHNSQSIDAMTHILPLYQQAYIALTPTHASLQSPMEALNLLNTMQNYFQNAKFTLKIFFLGYEPFQIKSVLNSCFQEMLSTQLMPRVLFQLGEILKNNTDNPEILYEALKGYLVFSPIAEKHPEWVKPPVQYYVNTNYNNSPDIKSQINQYLNAALAYPIDNLPLDQTLIEKTRERLRQIPPALFAYHELKLQSETSQNQFGLDQVIKSEFNTVFTYPDQSQASIPRLFSLQGFLKLQGKNTKNLILHTVMVYQILGLSNHNDMPGLATEMNPQVWHYYNQDYINAWNQYLNNIRVENFDDLNQAIQVLNILTQKSNPLSEILEKISENTATIRNSHMTVVHQFGALNNFIGMPGKPSAQYKILTKNLTGLRDYLSNLSASSDISQAEFQDASTYLQNKMPNNPIGILKRQARLLPSPLNQWVNNIADNSFSLLLQGAHHVINTAWQNTVMPAYQSNIENKFPFAKQTDNTVSLSSFGEFFGNGGVFSQFFKTYLSPFINTTYAPWSEYKVGDYSLGLSLQMINQLQNMDKIRALYFPNNDKNPIIKFSIQPRILDMQSKSIYLQFSNQTLIYRHGPQQIFDWHWPITGDTQQVGLSFNDFAGNVYSITLNGPWAWFSLMSSTQLQPTGSLGHYIWTINKNGHQASFDLWTANNMPVFDLSILQNLNLPPAI